MRNKQKSRIRRFTLTQRMFHLVLMLSFLIQSATGLSRMYMGTSWGSFLARLFGGREQTLDIHIATGALMIFGFLVHIIYLMFTFRWRDFPKSLFASDSLIPRPKDVKDFFGHIGWFFGRKKMPDFDRWGYWEKFDYWAVFWGMVIIGGTGLLLAFPLFFTRFVPGWSLNVAFWVHRIEAALAMAHVFVIHFFIAHLRRRHFPMDMSIFEGSVDIGAASHEKKAWVRRLRKSGLYGNVLAPEATGGRKVIFRVIGYGALGIGTFLLIGSLVNIKGTVW